MQKKSSTSELRKKQADNSGRILRNAQANPKHFGPNVANISCDVDRTPMYTFNFIIKQLHLGARPMGISGPYFRVNMDRIGMQIPLKPEDKSFSAIPCSYLGEQNATHF